MCVCVCVLCMWKHTHTYTHVVAHEGLWSSVEAAPHKNPSVCVVFVCVCVCVCVYLNIFMHTCTWMCVCVRVCALVCIVHTLFIASMLLLLMSFILQASPLNFANPPHFLFLPTLQVECPSPLHVGWKSPCAIRPTYSLTWYLNFDQFSQIFSHFLTGDKEGASKASLTN
jgi:hypothetical protein